MARNTRTFIDLDLNFIPSPIAMVINHGIGLMSSKTTSNILVGTNTVFTKYDMRYRNIYINGVYIGKVELIVDATHLQLYNPAQATFTNQSFTYSNPADVVAAYDDAAIKASVKNLILTSNYERKFHPELGTQVNSLLFEPATPILGAVLKQTISQIINNYEPRVNLTNIGVSVLPDSNSVSVTIEYTILNTQTPQQLNLVLERTR